MPIASTALALGLAKTSSDVFKEAMSFARNAKNSDLAEKLVDLYSDFVGLTDTNQQLRLEIQELKSEIESLKKRPDVASKLRYLKADGSYYLKVGDEKEDGPFCGVCWDIDGRLIRQTKPPGETIFCGYCNQERGTRKTRR